MKLKIFKEDILKPTDYETIMPFFVHRFKATEKINGNTYVGYYWCFLFKSIMIGRLKLWE